MSKEYTDTKLHQMKIDYMKYHTVEDPDGNKITNPDDIPDDWIINAIDSWTDKSK